MGEGCWELVTSDESMIPTKPLLDAIVMKDSQSDGRPADPANTNESGWSRSFCRGNNLDQIAMSETDLVPGEVIHQIGWTEVQETVSIGDLDRRLGSNRAAHSTINDGDSNLIHELSHDLGILTASCATPRSNRMCLVAWL